MLPFASHPTLAPNDTELAAVFLAILVGATVLVVSLAALLIWAGGRRTPRLPRVTPLDDQVAAMWQRQVQMQRPFVHQHRHAA